MLKAGKTELSLRIGLVFCFMIAFVFSLKSFREPDLWWQIRTGEWIIQNGSVPHQDIFSYTFPHVQWINIKWGFEVLAAFITSYLGLESVFIIQALVSLLIFFLMMKLSLLCWKSENKGPFISNHFLLCLIPVFLISLIACEYRMIGRPEMFSYLFVVLFIYLLERNRQQPSKSIFLIPLFQLFWANLHEAFATGLIILFIYLIITLLQNRYSLKIFFSNEIKQLLLIFSLSILAIFINPNGIQLLQRPLNIFSQLQENKFTTELIAFTDPLFWRKESYFGILFFLLSAYGFTKAISFKHLLRNILSNENLPFFICLLAFLFLSLSAYRNWPFLILTGIPFTTIAVGRIFSYLKIYRNIKPISLLMLMLSITLYIAIVSNYYYKITGSRDQFGLEVNSAFNPMGAAHYIKNNIGKDKRCFADYISSSCLLHQLQPDFKTFIDLRDLDIFPRYFFLKYGNAMAYPPAFFQLDSVYHFDYVVLSLKEFGNLHKYLYNDSIYACTFVDPVVAIYEKTDVFSRTDIFSECKTIKTSTFACCINKIFNPLYHSFDYRSVDYNYLAADYFIKVKQFDLAMNRVQQLLRNNKQQSKGYELSGQIYFNRALSEKEETKRNALMDDAQQQFSEALRIDEKNSNALMGKGAVLFYRGNFKLALENFEQCIHYNKENIDAFLNAAECCKRLLQHVPNDNELSNKLISYYRNALALNPGDLAIEGLLGLAYCSINKCDEAKQYLQAGKNYNFIDEQLMEQVDQCLNKCK